MSGPGVSARSAVGRAWSALRRAWSRVRANGWAVLQQSLAAGLAWTIADYFADDYQPFFAPIAAVVALNATLGDRGLQAVWLFVGVIVGIVVGGVTLDLLGTRVVALPLATLVAMFAAVTFGAARVTMAQAASSAILTVGIPYGGGGGPQRLFDAMIGVAVALVFSQVIFATHPMRLLSQAENTLVARLRDLLGAIVALLALRSYEQDGARVAPQRSVRPTVGTGDAGGDLREHAGRDPTFRVAARSVPSPDHPDPLRRQQRAVYSAIAGLYSARTTALNIVHHTVFWARHHRRVHDRIRVDSALDDAATAVLFLTGTLAYTTGPVHPHLRWRLGELSTVLVALPGVLQSSDGAAADRRRADLKRRLEDVRRRGRGTDSPGESSDGADTGAAAEAVAQLTDALERALGGRPASAG